MNKTIHQHRFTQVSKDDQRQYNCTSIMMRNDGTVNVFINNVYRLQPGEIWSGNVPEGGLDTTEYFIRFDTKDGTKLLTVIFCEQTS